MLPFFVRRAAFPLGDRIGVHIGIHIGIHIVLA